MHPRAALRVLSIFIFLRRPTHLASAAEHSTASSSEPAWSGYPAARGRRSCARHRLPDGVRALVRRSLRGPLSDPYAAGVFDDVPREPRARHHKRRRSRAQHHRRLGGDGRAPAAAGLGVPDHGQFRLARPLRLDTGDARGAVRRPSHDSADTAAHARRRGVAAHRRHCRSERTGPQPRRALARPAPARHSLCWLLR